MCVWIRKLVSNPIQLKDKSKGKVLKTGMQKQNITNEKNPERRKRRNHQENVPAPRQQLHWQNVSDVTTLELSSLLKACQLQKKTWEINCSQLLSISALSIVASPHSYP